MGSGDQKRNLKSAIQRIGDLEEDFIKLIQASNTSFGNVDQRLGLLGELVDALVGTVGAKEVDTALMAIRDAKAKKRREEAQAALAKGIEDGTLVETVTIGEKSLVIGRELDAEGVAVHEGDVQIPFDTFKPELKSLFLGKGPGESVEMPEGGHKFEISRLYDFVEKPIAPAQDAPEASAQPAN